MPKSNVFTNTQQLTAQQEYDLGTGINRAVETFYTIHRLAIMAINLRGDDRDLPALLCAIRETARGVGIQLDDLNDATLGDRVGAFDKQSEAANG